MYKVCIRCYTYNQARYIEDALNGFVMQETSFPFVATIVDDASTDETPQVITRYFDRYFDTEDSSVAFREETEYGTVLYARHKTNLNCFFAIVLLKENHYSQRKGKRSYLLRWIKDVPYVALCEGDDYWIDSKKLQKQILYMEEHPECRMCCHAVKWETDGEQYDAGCQHDSPCKLTTEEVIRNNGLYLATCSLVFCHELVHDVPAWRKVATVGDFPLVILGSLRGELFFFPEKMGVYRYMSKGSWTSLHFGNNPSRTSVTIDYIKNKVRWLNMLDKDTDGRYSSSIFDLAFHYYNTLFNAREIGFSEYFRAARKADEKHYGRVFKDFLIRYFSPLYSVFATLTGKRKKERVNE